jgi:hypothetical protein
MQQNPSLEANMFSVSKEIPRISRKPKVHHSIHNSRPNVPAHAQMPLLEHQLHSCPNFHVTRKDKEAP